MNSNGTSSKFKNCNSSNPKKNPTFKLGDACHLLKSEYTQYENKSRVSSLSMSVRIFAEFIYE